MEVISAVTTNNNVCHITVFTPTFIIDPNYAFNVIIVLVGLFL